jgi:hypothetical protein
MFLKVMLRNTTSLLRASSRHKTQGDFINDVIRYVQPVEAIEQPLFIYVDDVDDNKPVWPNLS